jgi:ABC-2 type transport system ATP-binding protein
MLEAIGLTKRYEDGLLALNGLNLEVMPGEIFCLLGANGAGKTTTINLFLNFINPTAGVAWVNGINVSKFPLESKKYLSYLPEMVSLYDSFTTRQNLDYFARLGSKKLSRIELDDIMDRAGLPEWTFGVRYKKLSKGQRQRLAIATLMIRDTENLLLDEPTAGLDPRGAADLCDLLRKLRSEGKAIIISTNDIFRAKEVADRVGIMKEGTLVMIRTREDFVQEDLEQVYLDYMLN